MFSSVGNFSQPAFSLNIINCRYYHAERFLGSIEMVPRNPDHSSSAEVLDLPTTGETLKEKSPNSAMATLNKAKASLSPGSNGREDDDKTQVEEDEITPGMLKNAVSNEGNEDMYETEQVATVIRHDLLLSNILEKERHEGILERRRMQATIHTAFTDLRIKDLEEQVRKVKIDLYNLPEDFELHERNKQHPVFRHTLQRSTADQFELRRGSMNVPNKDRAALEVLAIEQLTGSGSYFKSDSPTDNAGGLPSTYLAPKKLRVRSRPLIAHIQQVTGTHIFDDLSPFDHPTEQPNIVFLRPFKLLAKHAGDIKKSLQDFKQDVDGYSSKLRAMTQTGDAKKTFNDEDLLQDLKLLVDFLDEDLKPTIDLRQKIQEGSATDIEYEDLWHLFQCGDIVLLEADKSQAYRVLSFTGGRDILIDKLSDTHKPPQDVDGFAIDCLSIKFDGYNYVPQLKTFSIRSYPGRRPITSLPVYPLRFDKDSEGLKERLIAGGRHYLDVTVPPQSHRHLLGSTLDEPPHDIDSQVIIDTSMALSRMPEWRLLTQNVNRDQLTKSDGRETQIVPHCGHLKYAQGCCGSDIAFKDLDMDDMNVNRFVQRSQHMLSPRKASDLGGEDLMLLPREVHGFVLRNRQWVTLRIADLSEVRFPNSFDDLMLPDRHKSAIQALVQVHENAVTRTEGGSSTVGSTIDLVKGKGAGLILLLHGEPGVGKTSTAECVADSTKRPLFPITCGDIGETATEVEANLHYNFRMAHKWGCVLLLDEADVFLAKRNKTDLRRNAVTSVFLRSLEYYAGILFLTTNRVGSIDPAFKSRIHISLFYPKFDLEATIRLYTTYIKRTRAEQERLESATFKIKDKEILKFAKRHFRQGEKEGLGTWNGRQIRNAFQAAIALVEYESRQTKEGNARPALGEEQFKIVAESSREFDRYLVYTLGAAESDIARREEWRYDRFGNAEPKPTAPSQSYDHRKPGFYGGKRDETDDDDDTSSSDDSSDGDSGSNDESDSDDGATRRRSGKKTSTTGKQRDKVKWKNPQKGGRGHR
ncbi:hypothetical protein F5Y03DRAFT_33318 [Xylaria venustula]|nr:hypothetical protein F5Y03DRAFT_33318 [Xylaria venustula]